MKKLISRIFVKKLQEYNYNFHTVCAVRNSHYEYTYILLVGITAPGGSIGNMYGLMLARHELYPEVKKSGLCAIKEPLVIFTSEDSHYSVGELDLPFT